MLKKLKVDKPNGIQVGKQINYKDITSSGVEQIYQILRN